MLKIIIEFLGDVAIRKNAKGEDTRYQPIAVYVEGQRFPKERKYYLGNRPPLKVGKYSLDLSSKVSLQEGSENAPPIFDVRFNDDDLVPAK